MFVLVVWKKSVSDSDSKVCRFKSGCSWCDYWMNDKNPTYWGLSWPFIWWGSTYIYVSLGQDLNLYCLKADGSAPPSPYRAMSHPCQTYSLSEETLHCGFLCHINLWHVWGPFLYEKTLKKAKFTSFQQPFILFWILILEGTVDDNCGDF